MSRRERQRRRRRNKGGPGRIILLTLGISTAVLAIAAISAVGYVIGVAKSGPTLSELKPVDVGQSSVVYAKDGTRLGFIQSEVLRLPIHSSEIPQVMMDATIAIEDRRFYQHRGVDFEGVIRAGVKNLQSGDTVEGGSTLTMQLVRNLYTGDRSQDFKRKIREAKLAEELENVHNGPKGKKWILVKYINTVPYGTVGGQSAYGIQAASRLYFGKRAKDLALHEAALLAGLPQAPSQYSPFLNPEGAKRRRDDVLDAMVETGAISAERAAEAQAKDLGVERSDFFSKRRESYFFDYVRRELTRQYGRETVRRGGLKVYTTIDLKAQQQARAAIRNRLSASGSPSAALVSIEPDSGHIRAMASSLSYGDSKFDVASQGKRQPGSTFKIMVLMAAIRRGVDINKVTYDSKKLNFTDAETGAKIEVSNSDGGAYGGRRTLFQATVASDNTVFQQLALDVSPEAVRETAYDMGISSKLDAYPAEALGGLTRGVSPLEMARAYNTVNNGGTRKKPIAIRKVVFPDGREDTALSKTKSEKVFTDGETLEAIRAMKANVQGGTGTAAQLGFCPAAGKTGTTTAFKDAWFGGMTKDLTTMVWVGYPKKGIPMENVPGYGIMYGGKAPALIWKDFMMKAVDRDKCGDWPKPKEPFEPQPFFGKYAKNGAPGAPAKSSTDFYTYEQPPAPAPAPAPNEAAGEGTGDGGQQAPAPAPAPEPEPAPAPAPPAGGPAPPAGGPAAG